MKESIVDIPTGSGNKYRYEYVDGQTLYRGPVGQAPEIGEEDFLRALTMSKGERGQYLEDLDEEELAVLFKKFKFEVESAKYGVGDTVTKTIKKPKQAKGIRELFSKWKVSSRHAYLHDNELLGLGTNLVLHFERPPETPYWEHENTKFDLQIMRKEGWHDKFYEPEVIKKALEEKNPSLFGKGESN